MKRPAAGANSSVRSCNEYETDCTETEIDRTRGGCCRKLPGSGPFSTGRWKIEQGDHLFNEGLDIGVVSGIVGIVRYRVTALGKSNHAGTTMMKNRQDAMVGMAKLIAKGDALCRAIDDNLVFTVGTIHCEPGSENVIPGKVVCTFEMRHMDGKLTDRLIAKIEEAAQTIPNCKFTFEKRVDKGSVPCDKHLMDAIEQGAAACQLKYVVMPSGAGHDANAIGHRVPVGMIFVPSRDGLSHCKEEWTDEDDLANGVAVLRQTLEELGQAGVCARCALGMGNLPGEAPVEINLFVMVQS